MHTIIEGIETVKSKESENYIYADYNGSAPLDMKVREYLIERIANGPYSNPNASHKLGISNATNLEKCRHRCAKILGCKPKNIIFNSGSTEGISTVFHSLLSEKEGKNLIILSGIEHSAIYNNAFEFEKKGYETKILPTTNAGIVDITKLETWLESDGARCGMVSVMAANNETGVIQPFKEIASICQKYHVPYFCDTTQFIGKTCFNFADSGIDYAVASGHKFGALTGTGIIIAKDTTSLRPVIIGGGQEKGIRGGTQHYIGFETLPIALERFVENTENIIALSEKREAFEHELEKRFPSLIIIGKDAPRLATTSYISYPGLASKDIQKELQNRGVFVTTSSACSDSKISISKVLNSMHVSEEVGLGVVRISLGLGSPTKYYDAILDAITKSFQTLLEKKLQ